MRKIDNIEGTGEPMDVIVETDMTYMDRVRSRVASLPGYPLEQLLAGIDRTQDVEPLAAVFDEDRKQEFVEAVRQTGLAPDDALIARLPVWGDRFLALHFEFDGPATSSDLLAIADEFARYVAYELGLTAPRALLTDCVVGSATFKLSLGLDRANISNAVVAGIIVLVVQSCSQAVVDAQEHPQLVDFHLCAAENMQRSGVRQMTFYTDDGVVISCTREKVVATAAKIPAADYSVQDARPPRRNFRQAGVSLVVTGVFDDDIPPRMRAVGPSDAVPQMGLVTVSMDRELREKVEPGTTYEIEGVWRPDARNRYVFVVQRADKVEEQPLPAHPHDQHGLWLDVLRRASRSDEASDDEVRNPENR